jgi:hypothetical protein
MTKVNSSTVRIKGTNPRSPRPWAGPEHRTQLLGIPELLSSGQYDLCPHCRQRQPQASKLPFGATDKCTVCGNLYRQMIPTAYLGPEPTDMDRALAIRDQLAEAIS